MVLAEEVGTGVTACDDVALGLPLKIPFIRGITPFDEFARSFARPLGGRGFSLPGCDESRANGRPVGRQVRDKRPMRSAMAILGLARRHEQQIVDQRQFEVVQNRAVIQERFAFATDAVTREFQFADGQIAGSRRATPGTIGCNAAAMVSSTNRCATSSERSSGRER